MKDTWDEESQQKLESNQQKPAPLKEESVDPEVFEKLPDENDPYWED